MADYHRRRMGVRNSTWVIILTCLVNIHDVPAFSSTLSLITSPSRGGSSLTRKIASGAIRGDVYSFHLPVANEEPPGTWRICYGYTRRRSVLDGVWQLWCCSEVGNRQNSGDGNETSGNIQVERDRPTVLRGGWTSTATDGKELYRRTTTPLDMKARIYESDVAEALGDAASNPVVKWGDAEETNPLRTPPDALARPELDRRKEDDRLGPRAEYSPNQVASLVLQSLRHNDVPYPNHGCEVAIRFSSSSNPASRFAPGGMRTYLDDPSMPFYRILSEWDEMVKDGDLDVDDTGERANQQTRVRREGDEVWSTVAMDLVREDGCWLIERLWVDDESDLRGDGSRRTRLTLAELFDEDRLEVMSCRYADYDPARLGGGADSGDSGGAFGWLEEYPNPSLSPKAVVLTCIISLRQNDDGSTDGLDNDGSPAPAPRRPRNEGCERVIRFCSPTNVASTLTPAHFAQYLREPWYAILKEWDELAFHSEDVSDDGLTANLVVLLRPEGEEEWTSVNWELVKCDDMWLTERIWVVDV